MSRLGGPEVPVQPSPAAGRPERSRHIGGPAAEASPIRRRLSALVCYAKIEKSTEIFHCYTSRPAVS
jgi:hypothetical protein